MSGAALASVGKLEKGPIYAILGVGTIIMLGLLYWYKKKNKV